MRSIAFATMTALVMTASAPASVALPAAAQPDAERGRSDPDRICARYLDEDLHRTDYSRGPHRAAPLPAPPQGITVTGTRMRRPNIQSNTPVTSVTAAELTEGSVTSRVRVAPRPEPDRERYDGEEVASVQSVADAPVSTFSVDVDTGSYANVRRMLDGGRMPPQAAVRTEEMLNYFRYDYPRPGDRSRPFSISTDVTTTPWNAETRLLRVGLRGYDVAARQRPAANLVFLVDVSGSMLSRDKLPLVKCSLALVAEQMNPRDRVSIVVYAGAAGRVLDPTGDPRRVTEALGRLQAGGSTAGAQGMMLAYRTARENMIEGGINRVIMATDGDFNVGLSNNDAIIDMVERERHSGVQLTALGFGTGNYNEAMMEQVADKGNGNYAYIDSPREAQKVLSQELSSTLFTIAQDVKIQVEFNPALVAEYRLIGYENRALREEDFANDAVDAGDIGAGHQVTALYEIVPVGARGWLPERRYEANRRSPPEARTGELAHLRLRYKLPGQSESRLIEQPLSGALLRSARAPSGDTAFAVAVAAYGQLLRGDTHMGRFGFADARALAQRADLNDWWRREFVRLTQAAEAGGQRAER